MQSADFSVRAMPGITAPFGFFDPLGFTNALTDAEKARKRKAELKNGRLAMIGIMSIMAAQKVEGSVPALTKIGIGDEGLRGLSTKISGSYSVVR